MGDEDSIVNKEEVMERLLKCFCVGMQSPEVKQSAIKVVADAYSTVIINVFSGLFMYHAEKDAEELVPEHNFVSRCLISYVKGIN